jgi:hypothetical protein
VAATAGSAALGLVAGLSTDPPARVLVGLAGVLLLGLAALGWRQRPRLSIVTGRPPRLIVRGLFGPVEYRPDEITRARVVRFRRLGRQVPNLEIDVERDGTERLLIFGRWDLGTPPEDVFDALAVHGLVPEP